jgi:hypothetical protein
MFQFQFYQSIFQAKQNFKHQFSIGNLAQIDVEKEEQENTISEYSQNIFIIWTSFYISFEWT